MILYLIPTQFIVLLCMSLFTGYAVYQILSASDLFCDFLQWLLLFDLFVVMPWILGIFIGSLILKMKKQPKPKSRLKS